MVSQGLDARISESVRKGLDEALSPMLQGLLGGAMPVIPGSLAMLDGWSWKIESVQSRVALIRGAGPTPVIAPIQEEKGWINLLGVVFSDPMTELNFQCDSWIASHSSPWAFNLLGWTQANNSNNYVTVYNPATPMGPLYGLQWTPSQFWPYNNQIIINVLHPASAITATSQLVAFYLGRHYIRDDKQFYESVIREGKKQMVGRVEMPRGRR